MNCRHRHTHIAYAYQLICGAHRRQFHIDVKNGYNMNRVLTAQGVLSIVGHAPPLCPHRTTRLQRLILSRTNVSGVFVIACALCTERHCDVSGSSSSKMFQPHVNCKRKQKRRKMKNKKWTGPTSNTIPVRYARCALRFRKFLTTCLWLCGLSFVKFKYYSLNRYVCCAPYAKDTVEPAED